MQAVRGLYERNAMVVAVLCSVLSTLVLGSPVLGPDPIRCAPCTPEKLSQCPAVAPGCAEVLREPGCGCCLACALSSGELCGIYTAPCGSGLRCTPRAGDPRPLHSLTRGQAVCTEIPEPEPTSHVMTNPQPGAEPDLEMDNTAIISDPGSSLYLSGHNKPYDPRAAADAQESMKAKLIAIRKKLVEQGPCHIELQRALEKIARSQQKLGDKLTRFYLPNCDKHGLYKPKQCESSLDGQRGRCWCVNSWNGKKLLGSADVATDTECP
uniref:Insulin-like growth factor-binding protein 1 n=1 Tax=Periophthalmus magnuspinnatus TaxID=409849 RepID=A0A3B3ZP30_9GOBI